MTIRRIQDWYALHRARRAASRREELAFLPAARELRDTPPAPSGRAVLWTIAGLCVSAIAWASAGRVDIVAVAPGRLLPAGHVRVVQSPGSGMVRAIHARDGQLVQEGQVLIEFDPALAEADRTASEVRLQGAEFELVRQRAFFDWLGGPSTEVGPRMTGRELPALQRAILEQSVAEYRSRLAANRQAALRREADREATQRQVAKLERTLPLVARRTAAVRELAERDLLPRLQHVELEQQRIALEEDLAAARAQLASTEASIAELASQRRELESGTRRATLQRVAELDQFVAEAWQQQLKAARLVAQQVLVAPVAGEVQQLAVHTVGAVVGPGEPLLVIVPAGEPLEVEARILNRDIGFVREGQAAGIKVEAFPFTRYGIIPGQVVAISEDATPDEQLGPVYVARVRPQRTALEAEGRRVPLTSGMAVSVEILTGHRSLLDYVLSPLSRNLHESVRER